MNSPQKTALDAQGLSKTFGKSRVLNDVSFTVEPGEVIGLCGQNGSGKSTLIKILTGYHKPDSGSKLKAWGEPVEFPVRHPIDHGLAVIHQDLGLVDTMTVAENMGISVGYGARALSPVAWRREADEARRYLDRFNIRIPVQRLLSEISPSDRATVAILRTIRQLEERSDRFVLILDEPLAYLSRDQSQKLLELTAEIARQGSSVILVSHDLEQVYSVATRLLVLRDGNLVFDGPADETDKESLVIHMLGRGLSTFYPDLPAAPSEEVVLAADRVSGVTIDSVSINLRKGEILGVTGLEGSGLHELAWRLAQLEEQQASHGGGSNGSDDELSGVALVPGNRMRHGLWADANVVENITLPDLSSFVERFGLSRRSELAYTERLLNEFVVVPPVPGRKVSGFSGGNQQKIMLAKWLALKPKVLLLEEPTRGVDAGARREILQLVGDAAEQGAGIIIFSTDLEQIANTCHRAIVLSRGEAVGEFTGDDLSESNLLGACYGVAGGGRPGWEVS